MQADYSYFRAEGLSLQGIETAVSEKEIFQSLKHALYVAYGATSVNADSRDAGHGPFEVRFLTFAGDQNVPEGWNILGRFHGVVLALPHEDSEDASLIAKAAGVMERSARRSYLEYLFGVKAMPARQVPAGDYDLAFVCFSKLQGEVGDMPYPRSFLRDQWANYSA